MEILEGFATLVEMTDSDDQSQRNFNVIVNVLNATNTTVIGGDFNDTDLANVQLTAYCFNVLLCS